MTIGQVLKTNEELADIFLGFGMHCLYCPMSQQETLEEACEVHDVDVELLVKKLNEKLNEAK
jgi:hybrid cluster-associated redox disulfide protein